MMARSDGALGDIVLLGRGADNGPVQITATFSRYKNEDALCCPSARSNVTYFVELANGQPVVRPTQAGTTPTSPG
jgi:hypothetical protein